MKKIKLILIITILICNIIHSFGQVTQKMDKDSLKKAKEYIKKANRYFEMNDFKNAKSYYLLAPNFVESNAELSYRLGVSSLLTGYSTSAIPFLQNALKLNFAQAEDLHLMLGQAYHLNYRFNNAIKHYQKLIQTSNSNENTKYLNKLIQECKYGLEIVKDTLNINFIIDTNINTPYDEYNAVLAANNSLIYTSKRSENIGKMRNPFTNDYYEDIYYSLNRDEKWSNAKNMGNEINTKTNEAIAGISHDGNILYIFKDENKGDLFYSILVDDKWKKPKPFKKSINSQYTENSIAITQDSSFLFFTSNRKKDNIGGFDIYVASKNDKSEWGDIKNLGAIVNTEYNETGVFINKTGDTLFFSSQGHNTIGGYDIFRTIKQNGEWTKPENLGYPINTTDDDLAYSKTDSTNIYTYVDNKNGGLRNIALFTYLPDSNENIILKQDSLLLANTEIGNIEKESSLKEQELFNKNSETELHQNNKSESGTILGNNSETNLKEKNIHNLYKPNKVEKIVLIKNFTFETNSYIQNNAYKDLNLLSDYLKKNSDAKIKVVGYTDNVGSEEYNKKLSEKRASFVINHLKSNGVSEKAFEFCGEGETNFIAKNINNESKRYNRRVEFIVLKQGAKPLIVEQLQVPEHYKTDNNISKNSFAIYIDIKSEEFDISEYKNLKEIKTKKLPNNTYLIYVGVFVEYEMAKKQLNEILNLGYSNSFIFLLD